MSKRISKSMPDALKAHFAEPARSKQYSNKCWRGAKGHNARSPQQPRRTRRKCVRTIFQQSAQRHAFKTAASTNCNATDSSPLRYKTWRAKSSSILYGESYQNEPSRLLEDNTFLRHGANFNMTKQRTALRRTCHLTLGRGQNSS